MDYAVTEQEWYGVIDRSEAGEEMSDEERGKLLFNSFSRGHTARQSFLEAFGFASCSDCGMVVGPEEVHTGDECTVYRVMES